MPLAQQTYRWPDPTTGPYKIMLSLDERDGRLELCSIFISNPDAPVHITDLRRIPLGAWSKKLATELRVRWGPAIAAQTSTPEAQQVARTLLTAPGPRRGRRVLYPPSHWPEVADVYQQATDRPVVAVADHYVVSRSLARKWVERCRKEGLLSQP